MADGLQGLMEDKEMQDFLQMEQQKMELNQRANKLTEMCWDKCMTDKPSSKLDSRSETCLTNCVERFIDTSVAIASRFQNMLQKSIPE